ncbi:MAG: 5-carboxymethyl-2-hydroxymuconate Delta-isomerase [Gammaproteobacteria bacterium]|nr:5-carboxymethyl-2-hydroxymuconate Delta-isomerase [Gammaproteobacteria bacterium]MDH3466518.1 5-carboxymethyl-2-hydroxymuconate Delta-isomerase [Gammaproteobacteria bacterium]
MPQITLEYTANIEQAVNFSSLFSSMHQILSELGGVRIQNCKSRAICRDRYLIGDGAEQHAFVHVNVLLVAGRSQEWIQRVGSALLEALEDAFAASKQSLDLQITVNFSDMIREHYFKYPAGTLTPLEDLK